MRGIMADNDVQGQMKELIVRLESATWQGVWHSLKLAVFSFQDLGLSPDATDATLWHACQQNQVILITGNRNQGDPDSLGATIQRDNTPTSLPVMTLADTDRVMASGAYADRVVEKLLDYLIDMDNYRGTGRLYLP